MHVWGDAPPKPFPSVQNLNISSCSSQIQFYYEDKLNLKIVFIINNEAEIGGLPQSRTFFTIGFNNPEHLLMCENTNYFFSDLRAIKIKY